MSSISYRLSINNWLDKWRFYALMDIFTKYPRSADEITFFTSETHPCLDLDIFNGRIDIIAERMTEARRRGFRTGINVLSTIGHLTENLKQSLKGDYQLITGSDGKVCEGCICPGDDHLHHYVSEIYTKTARAKPDYIWIDDDIRFQGHIPISYSCFCDKCLSRFNRLAGTDFTRETAVAAFDSPDISYALKMRDLWRQNMNHILDELYDVIIESIRNVDPNIDVGNMNGPEYYEGMESSDQAGILRSGTTKNVMWRPGAGVYDESSPSAMINKAHELGRQCSLLPEFVMPVQSEIENFPYQNFRKTPAFTAFEACAYIASGCTGAAFNVLNDTDHAFIESEMMIKCLSKARPFFDKLALAGGKTPPQGIHTCWNKKSFMVMNAGDKWFKGSIYNFVGNFASQFLDLGLPAAYDENAAEMFLLSGNAPYSMSHDHIENILSKAVYMDVDALKVLNAMGYGSLTGFETGSAYDKDCAELFSDNRLNEGFTGVRRDARQSFYANTAHSIVPANDKAEILADLIDYGWSHKGACLGVYENESGGRICVAGYYPWTFLGSLSKSTQIKRIVSWLAKHGLTAWCDSYHKLNIWVKSQVPQKPAVFISNSTLMDAENVVISVRTHNQAAVLSDIGGKESLLLSEETKERNPETLKFVIPLIKSMELVLLQIE